MCVTEKANLMRQFEKFSCKKEEFFTRDRGLLQKHMVYFTAQS